MMPGYLDLTREQLESVVDAAEGCRNGYGNVVHSFLAEQLSQAIGLPIRIVRREEEE